MAVISVSPVNSSVRHLIRYMQDGRKTAGGAFVSAVNCSLSDAPEQMARTKQQFGKETGTKAYRVILTYLPNEITPQRAHLLAAELVHTLLPGYETVFATHLDKDFVHTHIVFNSVDLTTGNLFHVRYGAFLGRLREELMRLDGEHRLSLNFSRPREHEHYYRWFLKENGILPGQEMLEKDAGECLMCALDLDSFYDLMRDTGYAVTETENGPAFRVPGSKEPLFLTRDGKTVTEKDLEEIISDCLNSPSLPPLPEGPPLPPRPECIETLPELYRYYLDLVRFVGKGGVSPFPGIRYREVLRLKGCETRRSFLAQHGISTLADLHAFRKEQSERQKELSLELKAIREKISSSRRRYAALDTLERAADTGGPDRPETADDPEIRKAKKILQAFDPDALWTERIELNRKRKAIRAEYYRIRGTVRRLDFVESEIESIGRKTEYPFAGKGPVQRKEPYERKQRNPDPKDHERT